MAQRQVSRPFSFEVTAGAGEELSADYSADASRVLPRAQTPASSAGSVAASRTEPTHGPDVSDTVENDGGSSVISESCLSSDSDIYRGDDYDHYGNYDGYDGCDGYDDYDGYGGYGDEEDEADDEADDSDDHHRSDSHLWSDGEEYRRHLERDESIGSCDQPRGMCDSFAEAWLANLPEEKSRSPSFDHRAYALRVLTGQVDPTASDSDASSAGDILPEPSIIGDTEDVSDADHRIDCVPASGDGEEEPGGAANDTDQPDPTPERRRGKSGREPFSGERLGGFQFP